MDSICGVFWIPFGIRLGPMSPRFGARLRRPAPFFEDGFRARPVLCKHLPSVWAQFELPIWGSIATACAFFEDYFRARPVLCKHLPSVWAQFELCLGLIKHMGATRRDGSLPQFATVFRRPGERGGGGDNKRGNRARGNAQGQWAPAWRKEWETPLH